MHIISIVGHTKKRFHFSCAIRGLKMGQVMTELIGQWLLANEALLSAESKSQSNHQHHSSV